MEDKIRKIEELMKDLGVTQEDLVKSWTSSIPDSAPDTISNMESKIIYMKIVSDADKKIAPVAEKKVTPVAEKKLPLKFSGYRILQKLSPA